MSANSKKRKLGRPPLAGERGILLAGRVAPAVAGRVDDYAKGEGITRSEAVRRLIEAALGKETTTPPVRGAPKVTRQRKP